MKNINTVTVVESVPNDGACHVNSTSKPEELAEKVTNSESGCHVNMTSKCYSLMVPSGVDGIQMTGNGLIVQKESVTADEFNTVFRNVLSIHKSSCWLLGDILLLGDRQWGNQYTAGKYEEAIMATGLSRGTIRNIVLTCKKFPVEQRHPDLSFTHHLEVATTDADPNQRVEVLQQAAKDKLPVQPCVSSLNRLDLLRMMSRRTTPDRPRVKNLTVSVCLTCLNECPLMLHRCGMP